MKKGVLENLQENTCGLRNFQEHLSYRTSLKLQLYYVGALPTVFGTPQMNTLYLETLTLEVPFRYIISFSAA